MVTFKSIHLNSKKRETPDNGLGNMTIEEHKKFKNNKLRKVTLKTAVPLNNLVLDGHNNGFLKELSSPLSLFKPETRFSQKRASSEVEEAAAIKVQKAYKGYRTRRSLADCAVVVEELWWKALDFAALNLSSVSFFESDKSETAVSRWARARTRVAKVGKGLSKYEKAQKLALRHWLEAIDPRHRYGHNLHFYYGIWFDSESSQPFFYWLDIGDGKEVNLEQCPRTDLQHQCITYLGPKEREAYEVIVKSGKLVYKQSGIVVDTPEGTKWIFVLSTSRNLYVGEKQKGLFQHSSFLAGGATIAAGRLVAYNGVLEAIWAYSGHYRPTEENFMEFINFLEEQHLDLAHVKKFPIDDDIPPTKVTKPELDDKAITINVESTNLNRQAIDTSNSNDHQEDSSLKGNQKASKSDMSKNLSKKWSSGAGPRIRCVREYPTKLQVQALEQVNLSPRSNWQRLINVSNSSIPSARPSPKVHLSPKLAYMGLPSPNTNPY